MTGRGGDIILRAMKKIALHTLKTILLFLLLLASGLGYGAWYVASESLSSEKLTPLIEMAVNRLVPGAKAQIGESSVAWDQQKQTISLNCTNVRYVGGDGELLALYPKIGLEVNLWSLLTGRVMPRRMESDGAAFYLTRDKDGRYVLGSPVQASETAPESAPKAGEKTLADVFAPIADELSDSMLRQQVTITNATFHVLDTAIDKEWTIRVPSIALSHTREGASGKASIEVDQEGVVSTAELTYTFEPNEKFHVLALSFHDINLPRLVGQTPALQDLAGVDLPLTGTVSVAVDDDLTPMRGQVHVTSGEGTLTNAMLWKQPRKVKNAQINLQYDNSRGEAVLSDTTVDFEGMRLLATGKVNVPVHKRYAWKLPRLGNGYELTIRLENMKIDDFDAYWPLVTLVDARTWIAASLSKGVFPFGEVTLKGEINWKDLNETTLDTGFGKLAARGGTVLYMDGMPPVQDVDADASFTFHDMDVRITNGHTGAIKLQPFTIKLRDLHKDVQLMEIPANLSGPLKDVLALIDNKPLGYAKAVGLSPDDATGTVQGSLSLKMPLLSDVKMDDVHVEAKANLQDTGFKKLIPGIEISQGKLAFNLYSGGFTIKGGVALNGVAGQLDWASRFSADPEGKQPLHKGIFKTKAGPEAWAAFGLGDVVKTEGDVPLTIRYANLRAGLSTLGGDADFGAAATKIAAIGLDKPAGVPASLTFDGQMPDGKPYTIQTLNLQGKNLRLKGRASLDLKTGALLSAELNPYLVGRSNAVVSYAKNAATGGEIVKVSGESFDMSGIGGGAKPAVQPPQDYTVRVTKLQTSENGFINSANIRAVRDQKGWTSIDFFGVAQGQTPVHIELKPDDGVQALSIKTDNFGNLMKGMGYSDGVTGGNLEIWGRGEPDDPRVIKGKIRIKDFSVDNVSVFARLLSALSPFGFIDMITGNAHFDSLRGDFAWKGDDIDLIKVRAAGSVVGINVDGRLNLASGQAKLAGTVVPFSFVNGIIGSIPLLGDMITGGDGQGVIAASYAIEGPLADAKVSVNPVSLLTPGFLRNLFFSNDDGEPKIGEKKAK